VRVRVARVGVRVRVRVKNHPDYPKLIINDVLYLGVVKWSKTSELLKARRFSTTQKRLNIEHH
jgi:hypothetical protein